MVVRPVGVLIRLVAILRLLLSVTASHVQRWQFPSVFIELIHLGSARPLPSYGLTRCLVNIHACA